MAKKIETVKLQRLHALATRDPDILAADAVTEEAVQEVFEALQKLLEVFYAAVEVLGELDPRRYGDLTEKQEKLRQACLHFSKD